MPTYGGNLSFGNWGQSFGTAAGAAGALAAAPATGGASALLYAIPMIYQMLQGMGLFGSETDDQEKIMDKQYDLQKMLLQLQRDWAIADKADQNMVNLKVTEQLKPNLPFYQSPYTGAVDRTAMEAIMNQMNRSKNWGYPAGKQVNMPNLTNLLTPGAPGSIDELSKPPVPPAPGTLLSERLTKKATDQTACVANCTSQYGSMRSENPRALNECIRLCQMAGEKFTRPGAGPVPLRTRG